MTTENVASQVKMPEWLVFPALDKAWSSSPERAIARISKRLEWYQELSETAAPVARTRARVVALSYQRVLAVLKELEAVTQLGGTITDKTQLQEKSLQGSIR
jgi:hypothetical protein